MNDTLVGSKPRTRSRCAIPGLYCAMALFGALHASTAIALSFRVPIGEQSITVAVPVGFANAADLDPALLSYVQALVGGSGHILGLLLTPADIEDIRSGRKPTLSEFLSVTTDPEWSSRVMTQAQFTTELMNLAAQLGRNSGSDPTGSHVLDRTLIERFSIRPNCEGFLMTYGPVSVGSALPGSAIQGIAIMHVRGKLLFLQITRLQDSRTATGLTKQQLISWALDMASLNAGERSSP